MGQGKGAAGLASRLGVLHKAWSRCACVFGLTAQITWMCAILRSMYDKMIADDGLQEAQLLTKARVVDPRVLPGPAPEPFRPSFGVARHAPTLTPNSSVSLVDWAHTPESRLLTLPSVLSSGQTRPACCHLTHSLPPLVAARLHGMHPLASTNEHLWSQGQMGRNVTP